jgi:glutamate-ammonia-ligase adenylyltransferase
LVRARVVAGDERLVERFTAVRREVLSCPRDREVLRREVCEMRARMRAELGHPDSSRFDLKQDAGGIADIEFMVQYAVLAWAHEHPELLRYTDNIRQLEGLSRAGLLPAADADLLADAYRAYRARVHRLTLQQEAAVVGMEEFAARRAQVTRLWRELMEA